MTIPRIRIRTSVLAALAAISAVGLTACGGDESTQQQAGGRDTLVWAKSFDIQSIDPGYTHEVTGEIVLAALYDQLLTFKDPESPTPQPLVAKSYEVTNNEKTFTFALRRDVTFSDGSKLTSDDVVFSIRRLKNLKAAPSYRTESIASVKAAGPYTVVINTKTPTPALPAIVAGTSFSILNADVVKEHGGVSGPNASKRDEAQTYLDQNSAGSGPYVLRSYDRRSRVTLEANPHFWGEKPGYKTIVIKNVPAENQLLELQKGSSELAVDLSPTQVSQIPDDSELQIVRNPSTTFFFLYANTDPSVSQVAANKDFQEAVRYGIDYQNIVELVGEGAAQIPGVIPSTIPGHLPESAAIQRDVERAKAALARSGIENPTVKLEYPNDFTLNGLSFGTIAQRIQSQLKEVGIRVELTPGPLATTLANWRAGKEEMGLWTTTPEYPAPHVYLSFCPGGVHALRANWDEGDNPPLERTCEQAADVSLSEPVKLDSAFGDVQRTLNEEGPYFPLFQPAQVIVAAESVTNIKPSRTRFVQIRELGR